MTTNKEITRGASKAPPWPKPYPKIPARIGLIFQINLILFYEINVLKSSSNDFRTFYEFEVDVDQSNDFVYKLSTTSTRSGRMVNPIRAGIFGYVFGQGGAFEAPPRNFLINGHRNTKISTMVYLDANNIFDLFMTSSSIL